MNWRRLMSIDYFEAVRTALTGNALTLVSQLDDDFAFMVGNLLVYPQLE